MPAPTPILSPLQAAAQRVEQVKAALQRTLANRAHQGKPQALTALRAELKQAEAVLVRAKEVAAEKAAAEARIAADAKAAADKAASDKAAAEKAAAETADKLALLTAGKDKSGGK